MTYNVTNRFLLTEKIPSPRILIKIETRKGVTLVINKYKSRDREIFVGAAGVVINTTRKREPLECPKL